MSSSRRLIRRRPLVERIKSLLNPYDFLLWLSEELESSDWEQWQNDWATPIGVAMNFTMLIARANSSWTSAEHDDVFGDAATGGGLLSWFVGITEPLNIS